MAEVYGWFIVVRPKDRKDTRLNIARRSPLHVEIAASLNPSHGVKKMRQRKMSNDEDDDEFEGGLVDATMSAKILKLAQSQQKEDCDDEDDDVQVPMDNNEEPTIDAEGFVQLDDNNEEFGREMSVFTASRTEPTRNLADLIMEKIREREAGAVATSKEDGAMDPRITEVYTSVGAFLSSYRSGRIPKAFKIIPRLANWEEVLYLTDPLSWTPNAMHEAVRIFASNLKPRMAQRFFNLVLLPAIRDDIDANKKLHFHYYQALKQAFFKPSAWFQGILFPLLLSGCTWREAVIFGSVLAKISIPPLHSAAALVRLCDLHKGDLSLWSASTTYIINILLNKKAALPTTAVNSVFKHFLTFDKDLRVLPVVWHQTLLTFVQRYKLELTATMRSGIRHLVKIHCHHLIGPEIRRELQHAENANWMPSTDVKM